MLAPDTRPCAKQPAASGPAVTVVASRVLASEASTARLQRRLVDLLAGDRPVAVRVRGIGRGRTAVDRLCRLCEKLARAIVRAGLEPALLELTLAAVAMPPRAAVYIRQSTLGAGIVNLLIDDTSMAAALRPGPHQDDRTWLQLWQLRSESVCTAFWPAIRSSCPLLSSEHATDVVPGIGLQAPSQSAFVIGTLDLVSFADDTGAIDTPSVEHALCDVIDDADTMHEATVWPTPAMQQDSWFNRRIAICVTGIGDIALQRGLDPELHASVLELDALLDHIRRFALRRSQAMARSRDMLPAIRAQNPCSRLQKSHSHDAWEQRWLRAIESSASRHRNLLAMSPWSVFPTGSCDFRYANLLPLLAHVDACTFRRSQSLQCWNIREFIQFHRRAWAIWRQRESTMVVAEQL